ncbi:hypothetical protein Kisp02_40510 [Kineosporia sp. NBRC 101731]|nr:hypothetical protein Kisp02_40510 [Kineosporia sp. NBRC 101731]
MPSYTPAPGLSHGTCPADGRRAVQQPVPAGHQEHLVCPVPADDYFQDPFGQGEVPMEVLIILLVVYVVYQYFK